jgi:hypothetical protein
MAGFLLLSHQMLPHRHHSDLLASENLEQHSGADSIFEFLQLIFHEDLGSERHLADITINSPAFVSQPADYPDPMAVLCVSSAGSEFIVPYRVFTENILSYSPTGDCLHRGPPASC